MSSSDFYGVLASILDLDSDSTGDVPEGAVLLLSLTSATDENFYSDLLLTSLAIRRSPLAVDLSL